MKDKWTTWYQDVEIPEPYGDTLSYEIAAEFLHDCLTIADWGCGKGFFRTRVLADRYVGIDGTITPFTDVVADLSNYIHQVEGILLRHVLEHNVDWQKVLLNAVNSATYKLCIILFTPLSDTTRQIAWTDGLEVPDISFYLPDIMAYLEDFEVTYSTFTSATQYGEETVIKAVR